MADSAIGELIPLNLQLAKCIMEMTYYTFLLGWLSSELDVINMLVNIATRAVN